MYLWEWSWKNDGTDDSIPLFILVSLRSSEPPAKPLGFYSLLGKHVLFLLLHKYSQLYGMYNDLTIMNFCFPSSHNAQSFGRMPILP